MAEAAESDVVAASGEAAALLWGWPLESYLARD